MIEEESDNVRGTDPLGYQGKGVGSLASWWTWDWGKRLQGRTEPREAKES